MARIEGTDGPDSLPGTTGADDPAGTDDTILGLAGDDTLEGLGGNDELHGEDGNDSILGDLLLGGPELPPSGALPGSNLIFGGAGADGIAAGYGADTVFGGAGDDRIAGFGAFDGSPSGFFALKGQDGHDRLAGEEGNDSIDGGGGVDIIEGGAGDDTIQGDLGADLLTGGPGADSFVLERAFPHTLDPGTGQGEGNRDIIPDFEDGLDRFLLRGLEPTGRVKAPSVFLGTDPFAASFGLQVRFEVEGDRTILQVAPGVVGSPPPGIEPTVPTRCAEVELIGVHRLTAADFDPVLLDGSGPPPPPPPEEPVDWNALAAEVAANFLATGQWFPGQPVPAAPDWNALAAAVTANFETTGQWFL